MRIIKGNLWDSKDDVILVTTNSFVKKNGELVMGRGAAKELKTLVPEIPRIFGLWINNHCADTKRYGIMLYRPPDLDKIYGAFQVKYNWWEDASLSLIEYSVNELSRIIELSEFITTVSMNFPGIGNGRLKYEDVLPIISRLPESVSVYIKE